jgi:hypothetical protein
MRQAFSLIDTERTSFNCQPDLIILGDRHRRRQIERLTDEWTLVGYLCGAELNTLSA